MASPIIFRQGRAEGTLAGDQFRGRAVNLPLISAKERGARRRSVVTQIHQ